MREYVWLECTVCGNRNYRAQKETRGADRLELKKYCRRERKHTPHKESRKKWRDVKRNAVTTRAGRRDTAGRAPVSVLFPGPGRLRSRPGRAGTGRSEADGARRAHARSRRWA